MGCLSPIALRGQSADTTKPYTLPPTTVSVTRAELPLTKVSQSIHTIGRQQINEARPTQGLDEALINVPGVYVANRYNFSQDQRISIRGFGSRSAFAVRGIKVLLDGIPQTLPDGQGQLTNVELGEVDRIEVLRGSSSSLFGNASGGVISIWTNPQAIAQVREDARFVVGRSGSRTDRTWSKWQSTTGLRIGSANAQLTVSRLNYEGERNHSAADIRVVNARAQLPVGSGWTLALVTDYGNMPRADNPGSLTLTELHTNRDTAPVVNVNRNAGKDVNQLQAGATLRRTMANGGEMAFTTFALTRDLQNPITTTYIDLERFDYGARASITYPAPIGSRPHRLTAGVDFQRQRDDRKNFNYLNTPGDSAKRDTTRALDQRERVSEFGPFVQSALELSSRMTMTAGLRYDWVKFAVEDHLITGTNPDDSGERLMNALSGSLGMAFNPSSRVTVYGNVGSSFETPTTTELANSATGSGGFNPDLKPQKAWNYEIGARGTVDGGGRLAYSVALFQADISDALVPYELAAPRFYYRNAGSSRHRGLEVGSDLRIVTGVTFAVSWTYADYRYRNYSFVTGGVTHTLDGRAIPGVPKHWLNMVLRGEGMRGVWGEVQQTYSSDFLVSDTLNTRSSPWWSTNVRVGWRASGSGIRLAPFVGVNNAFNHKYVSSVVINAARDRFYEPAPGRNAYIGLSLGAGR